MPGIFSCKVSASSGILYVGSSFLTLRALLTMATRSQEDMGFALKYEGPAVERGRMDARELGPALISVANLLERTSQLLWGEGGKVRVDVDADFQQGSFFIDFAVAPEWADQLSQLNREDLKLILQVLGVTGGGGGLIALLKWLRGRKPDKVEPQPNGGISISIDAETLTLNVNETKVYLDQRVRESLDGVVEPIRRAGIDAVEFGPDHQLTERVEKNEAEYFKAPATPEAVLSEDEITATVEVVAPAFKRGNAWRFFHSGGTFWASIADDRFWQQVEKRAELFGAGDVLRVRAKVTTTRTEKDVKYAWEILEVLEHIPGGTNQGQLQFLPRPPQDPEA